MANKANEAFSVLANQIKTVSENVKTINESLDTNHKTIVDLLTNILATQVNLEARLANLETKSAAPKRAATKTVKSDTESNTPTPVQQVKDSTAIKWFARQYSANKEFVYSYIPKDVYEKHMAELVASERYTSVKSNSSKTENDLLVVEVNSLFNNVIKKDKDISKKLAEDHKAYLSS
jgi:phage-related minor tail protein